MEKRRWTDEEICFLKTNYDKKTTDFIANFLNRTKDSVYKKAKRLGLTKEVKNWTERDIKLLCSYWGRHDIEIISKRLKRSVTSIRKKVRQLKLGPQHISNGEYLSTGDIGFLLNKNPCIIYKWIKKGFIRGKPFGNKPVYRVSPQNFLKFLKKHPQKWCAYSSEIELIKPYFYTSTNYTVPKWFMDKVTNTQNHVI